MSENALVVQQHPDNATELSVEVVLARLGKIQDLTKRAMVPNVDYGVIPGTKKPTLLKPGAEKMCVMFRLAPKYATTKTFHADGHLTVESSCEILDYTGVFLGEASAMCSTREAKYAYRRAGRSCPQCGKQSIIKGQEKFGGGWVCWRKKDGCGATFADNDTAITSQIEGRVPNEDLADAYNTVLRIAEKRSFVAAVRLVTGSSAMFDEEMPGAGGEGPRNAGGDYDEGGFPRTPPPTAVVQPAPDKTPPTFTAAEQEELHHWQDWLEMVKDNLQSFNTVVRQDLPGVKNHDVKRVLWRSLLAEGSVVRGYPSPLPGNFRPQPPSGLAQF